MVDADEVVISDEQQGGSAPAGELIDGPATESGDKARGPGQVLMKVLIFINA
jgi:hypothetical protein